MSLNLREETKHLDMTLEKLQKALAKLEARVTGYAEQFKESMKYLWENKNGMDAMEKYSNEKAVSQVVNTGEFIVKQKKVVEKLIDSPYFARIDFMLEGEEEAEQFYIGRFSFIDSEDNMLIYDWRAPISSMYYDFELGGAFYEAPIGVIEGELTQKRQFKIKNSNMEYALESSISIGDEVLQRELSHTSDQRMKNIVATIQKEQNKIIRNEKAEVLVIQGAAGSGKTSIALHRAAFFLYKYKDRLSAENIVVISPNKVFADYISNVLPELGEEPITEVGFEDIAAEQLNNALEFERFAEQVESLLEEEDEKKVERIRFKSSFEFLALVDEYLQYVDENYFNPQDYTFGKVTISKELILKGYNSYKKLPIFQRLAEISDTILEKIKTESLMEGTAPSKKEVMKKLLSMFRFDSTLELYTDFYQYINRPEMFVFKSKNKLENADVFPYIYIKVFLEGLGGEENIQHVVIDEMQDYTPVQYAVIKKLYKCRKTILGDFGQNVNPYNSTSLASFGELFGKVEVVELNKSYRSTYEIIKFAQKIQNQNIDPVERHGEEPYILQLEDLTSELAAINRLVGDFKSSNLSTLGIICKTNRQARELYKELVKEHDVNLLDFNSSKFINGITITSIHMSKGLEFDEVIIPSLDSVNYQSEYDRSLLYIACTRAMHKLTLTHCSEASGLLPK